MEVPQEVLQYGPTMTLQQMQMLFGLTMTFQQMQAMKMPVMKIMMQAAQIQVMQATQT